MPISSQINSAYVPRFYPELDENGNVEVQRTVSDVKVDVEHLVPVPEQRASTCKRLLIVLAIILAICLVAALIITLSILLTRATTTTVATTTTTVTTTTATTATTVTTTTTTTTTSTSTTTTAAPAAPGNMVGYRGNINQTYTFTATGASGGGIWGTNIYTDDSSIPTAAVHAGALALGQTGTVVIMMLAGQSSYTSSTQNGITSSSWGGWAGSYEFVFSSG